MRLKFLLSLLTVALLWVNSAFASSHIRFEFINRQNNQQVESFPINTPNEIIVASDDLDMRTLLPIDLEFRYDNQSLKTTIPADPVQFCRGPTGCSKDGPIIAESEGGYLQITAIDKDGNILAYYQTGTLPADEQSSSPIPTVSPSPTSLPADAGVAELEKDQVQEAKQPILSNRNLGILLILVALLLIAFATTSGGCPDLCTEGDCQNCEVSSIRLAVSGTAPGEIEGLLGKMDYLGWLSWLGVSPFGKSITAGAVEKAKKYGEKLIKLGMQINGVDVYATITYEECKKVSCWIFWTRTDWVKEKKEDIKIPPLRAHRYLDQNAEAWRPDRLFAKNKKTSKEIANYIKKEAEKHCPEKCRSV